MRSCECLPAARWILAIVATACVLSGCDRPDAAPPQQPSSPVGSEQSGAPSVAEPSPAVRVAPVAPVPTFELSRDARQASSADGTYTVRWEPADGAIPDAEPFAIRCEVARADGKPLARDVRVLVDAEMPHHGHGMNLVPTVAPAGAGKFLASGMLLHMPGRWVIAIDVEEGGVAERAQWYVDIE